MPDEAVLPLAGLDKECVSRWTVPGLTCVFFRFAAFLSAHCFAISSLFSSLETSASSSVLYKFSYHAKLRPSSGRSAYELPPFGNHFQLLKVFHFIVTKSLTAARRRAQRPSKTNLSFVATKWLTHGFLGDTGFPSVVNYSALGLRPRAL